MSARLDVVASLIPEGGRVLDVGCGEGALLSRLAAERRAKGYGLEIDAGAVAAAVAQGLSVVQGDAETDLFDYPAGAFDVVVLSNSIQTLHAPLPALRQALEVGKSAVVAFPNFGHWRVRMALLSSGRMPRSGALPAAWHETDNIHLCTIKDFVCLCREEDIAIRRAFGISSGKAFGFAPGRPGRANLLAHEAVFLLQNG